MEEITKIIKAIEARGPLSVNQYTQLYYPGANLDGKAEFFENSAKKFELAVSIGILVNDRGIFSLK